MWLRVNIIRIIIGFRARLESLSYYSLTQKRLLHDHRPLVKIMQKRCSVVSTGKKVTRNFESCRGWISTKLARFQVFWCPDEYLSFPIKPKITNFWQKIGLFSDKPEIGPVFGSKLYLVYSLALASRREIVNNLRYFFSIKTKSNNITRFIAANN